jgi:D-sedoheptulose 7-phosphate isomerase
MTVRLLGRGGRRGEATEPGYQLRTQAERDANTAVTAHLLGLAQAAEALAVNVGPMVARAAGLLVDCLTVGGKVLTCGNGGSAADAQHLSAELVGRFAYDRPALPAVTLSADSSVMTALGNDYGYDMVFARQVRALGRAGDVLVAISTSGRSPNVVRAVETASEIGISTIVLTGPLGHPSLTGADAWLGVGSARTDHVQELHTALLHSLCATVERVLFPAAPTPRD